MSKLKSTWSYFMATRKVLVTPKNGLQTLVRNGLGVYMTHESGGEVQLKRVYLVLMELLVYLVNLGIQKHSYISLFKLPINVEQQNFNYIHAKERVVIERYFGQLKRRFPMLGNCDGTSDFLPKLPCLSRIFGSLPDSSEENIEDAKRIKDQSQLNFLFVGTCDGNLYLSVFGVFSCGVININKYITMDEEGQYISVLKTELSSDMKSLFLLVAVNYADTIEEENERSEKESMDIDSTKLDNEKSFDYIKPTKDISEKLNIGTDDPNIVNDGSSEGKINKENKGEIPPNADSNKKYTCRRRGIKVVVLDTRVLSSRSRELHALSLKHGHIISLLDYLSQTMKSIVEAWENIHLLDIEAKLAQHAETVPEGSISADFLELLLTGVPSEDLGDFLFYQISDKSIKKLGHSIELSHSNIQKLILKHLLSVGQSLAYHLAEMKGMAKLTDRFKVLGLVEETVAEAFSAAGAFLIKSTEVQLVIDESMKKYKAFFRWLYCTILRFSDDRILDLTMTDSSQQELEFIADYLSSLDFKLDEEGCPIPRQVFLDRLGQYLQDDNLISPNESGKESPWQKLLEANPCLQEHFSIVQKSKNTSLIQQHKILIAAIENVFKTPEYAVGDMFHLKKIVDISNTRCKRITMCLADDSTVLISLVEENDPNNFKFFQVLAESNNSDTDVVCKTVSFMSEEKTLMKCLDVQFYLPEILSVLFEEQDEYRDAVIAQINTKSIYENTLDVIDGSMLKDSVVMRQIPDLVASKFAVSGTRKVAVVLSSSRRKVRLFEMEAEEDDDEDEMPEQSNSLWDSPKVVYKTPEKEDAGDENISVDEQNKSSASVNENSEQLSDSENSEANIEIRND